MVSNRWTGPRWLSRSAGGNVFNRQNSVCSKWKRFLGDVVTRCLLRQCLACFPSPGSGRSPGSRRHRRPRRSSSRYRQWWRDPLVSSPRSLSLSALRQGPQGDKGSWGETVRSLLTNPLSPVWAVSSRRRSAFLPSAFFHFLLPRCCFLPVSFARLTVRPINACCVSWEREHFGFFFISPWMNISCLALWFCACSVGKVDGVSLSWRIPEAFLTRSPRRQFDFKLPLCHCPLWSIDLSLFHPRQGLQGPRVSNNSALLLNRYSPAHRCDPFTTRENEWTT